MNQHMRAFHSGKQFLILSMFVVVISGIIGMISFMSQTAVVHAVSFTVDLAADATDTNPGDGICKIAEPPKDLCTLRAAIEETNALPGADEIIIPAGEYILNRAGTDDTAYDGDLDILDDLTIRGDAAATTFIDGGGIDRVFHITDSVSLTVTNVTVRNGQAVDGAGILNAGGTLTVISSTIQSNQADNNGGGINNLSGSVSLSNSVIFNNRADKGGGIYNLDSSGTMSLIDSSLISNTAVASGGAVFNGGLLTMMSSTVSTNTAVISGGGIIQLGGVMTVTNSTLSGNEAPDGSGIYNNNSNALLLNSTIHNNIATFGAGIAHLNGLLALKNTIVSFNLPGGDCTGAVVSNGHNLDSDDSCNLVAPSDHPGVDPLLDPLQDNGGPTWTHALQWGSPAIEGGDSTRCPATDQRGVGRFGVCDIGAYEFEIELLYLPSVLNSSITGTPTPTPTPNNCRKQVPVFTTDTAPTDGTLEFHVLYGELGRIEGITLKVWDVAAGQQINNELVDVKAPKWVRVWWQPDGDPEWYLLPSQYWVGDGTVYSEYGVSCGDAPVPSYHTSFGSAIPESDVPIFTLPLGEDWAALIKLVQFQRVDQAEELNP